MAATDAARRAATWSLRAFLVVVEQATYSWTHFLVGILLVRLLPPATYGAFGMAFALFLLVAMAYNCLLPEAAVVFGSGRYRETFADYLGLLLRLHLVLVPAIVLLLAGMAAIAAATGEEELATSLLAFAAASPLVLLYWLVRRLCYIPLRLGLGLVASTFYAVLLLGGLFLAGRVVELAVPGVLALMAAAAGGASALVLVGLRPRLSPSELAPSWRAVASEHVRYGSWLLLASAPQGVQNQAPLLLAGWLLGLDAAGVLRAYLNFILPVPLLASAFVGLMLTVAARRRHTRGVAGVRQVARFSTWIAVGASGAYALAVVAARDPLASLVLGPVYAPHADLLLILMLWPVLFALATGASVAIRAFEQPQVLLLPSLAGAVTTVGLGVSLIPSLGVVGAAVAHVAGQGVTSLGLLRAARDVQADAARAGTVRGPVASRSLTSNGGTDRASPDPIAGTHTGYP